MSKVFKLIVDEDNEPVILEEDEVLEDILIRLESISHRIDDIQYSLIKNNDEASSLDLDISEIDFQSIKKYGVNLTPYYVIIKIQETPSYFKLPRTVYSPKEIPTSLALCTISPSVSTNFNFPAVASNGICVT